MVLEDPAIKITNTTTPIIHAIIIWMCLNEIKALMIIEG